MIECQVLTTNKKLFSDRIRSISVPAVRGQMQILPDHAESFVLLQEGELELVTKQGKLKTIKIEEGLLHIQNNRLVILL